MSDLDIEIKLDPAAATAGAKRVSEEVAKTEKQAKETKAAFDALGATFKAIAIEQQRVAAEAQKLRTGLDQAAQGFKAMANAIRIDQLNQTAKGFGQLAEAIRREEAALRSIHGDTRQYMEELQTLDALLKKGTISANQHAAAVAKSQARNGIAGASGQVASGAPPELAGIAAGVAKLNLNQIAAGANQAFELLNQKLKITESRFGSVVGSAVKFGAMGMQVGGPWGAAIAGVTGGLVDLYAALTKADEELEKHRQQQQKEAKDYWDNIEAAKKKKEIEQELGPVLAEHAKQAGYAADAENILRGVMDKQPAAYREATAKLHAYEQQLDKVNGQLSIKLRLENRFDVSNDGGQTPDQATEITAARGVRDAHLQVAAANKSYGAVLVEVVSAEQAHLDRLQDLADTATDNSLKTAEHTRAWKLYNEELKKAVDYTAATHEILDPDSGAASRRNIAVTSSPGFSASSVAGIDPQNDPSQLNNAMNWQRIAAGKSSLQQYIDAKQSMKDNEEATKRWNLELYKSTDVLAEMNELGATAFKGVENALVQLATTGKMSFREMANSIISDLARIAAQKLVASLIGGIGSLGSTTTYAAGVEAVAGGSGGYAATGKLPGFATGGDMLVGGAGGTDSRIAAFRVTPGESIHVRTPQQRREAEQAQGGGRGVQVVYQPPDPRALLQNMAGPDHDRVVIDVLRRNAGVVQALIPGRR